jgi:riboflavin kinase/FMN adenylyltransferase
MFVKGVENYTRTTDRPLVVTIGTFDGIHLGHQEILRQVRLVSKEGDFEPVLVTFHPHPRVLVTPGNAPLLLTTIEEKERFLPDYFDGTVLTLSFDEKLMNLTPEEFVKDILVDRIGAKKLIVGYDHAFGKNRSGTLAELKRLGQVYDFDVQVVGPVLIDNQAVSSSRIRRAMIESRYRDALRLLGHDYAIFGSVEKGIGLGMKLGYPTANVRYSPRKLLPTYGVYTCRAQVGRERFNGVMFIGRNHFNPVNHISVEANLFDFDRDIYNEEVTVFPIHYVRENHKFGSTKELAKQIEKDKEHAMQLLERERQHVNDKRAKSSNYC